MTTIDETTTKDPTTARRGRPPVVDVATWQTAPDELPVREKAHTRTGDAIAAARRRLPMVEIDGTVEVVGPAGPVLFLDLFRGRDELGVYQHMWHDGAPHQGQCEGCTVSAWLRAGDRVFLTYSTTGRGTEQAARSFALLDLTPYGRGEAWQDNPEGWPEGNQPCWYWRTDANGTATWGPTGRPAAQWTRPDETPEDTLGRHGHHH